MFYSFNSELSYHLMPWHIVSFCVTQAPFPLLLTYRLLVGSPGYNTSLLVLLWTPSYPWPILGRIGGFSINCPEQFRDCPICGCTWLLANTCLWANDCTEIGIVYKYIVNEQDLLLRIARQTQARDQVRDSEEHGITETLNSLVV